MADQLGLYASESSFTVHLDTNKVLNYMCVNTEQVPKTVQEWKNVANNFFQQWQFPHCIGSLDGKHVHIQPPPNSGSLYDNCKHFNSIVLLMSVYAVRFDETVIDPKMTLY